ncbi:hypothetical protein [Sulfurimonas sp.]|uniref:hypothetical protein n=1 Tax=Sulfurimonas sp. TaxID=2022749 RepID=UPI0035634A48
MDVKDFQAMMEKPIYASLDEVFDKSNLSETEKDAFLRNEKYCKYWLLRSKRYYNQSLNSEKPNFIKKLARVINHLESDLVTGAKIQKIKEMFAPRSPIHKVTQTEISCRSEQNSPILENTYFELLILSFFVERGFNIELISNKEYGTRIPEFIASKNGIKLSIEAKNLNVDNIMNNIFGDSFKDGIDHHRTQNEQEKGYKNIKSQIEKRYEDAMDKYNHINSDEQYIIFMSIYFNNHFIGKPAINYVNSLQAKWIGQELRNFIGIVIPEEQQTLFIKNQEGNENIVHQLTEYGLEEFHKYVPS